MSINLPKINLESGIKQILGFQIAKPTTLLVGNPITGAVYVDNSDKKGLFYAYSLGGDPNDVKVVVNDLNASQLIPGTPIRVKRDEDGYWHFTAYAPEAGEYLDNINANDQIFVNLDQILDGGLRPLDSPQVGYVGATYTNSSLEVEVTTDQDTGNLIDGSTDDTSATAIEPPTTANRSIYVLVQIDPTTNTLSYKQSAEFLGTFSYTQAASGGFLPDPDTGNRKAGYVRLNTGTTTLKRENIVSQPDIFGEGGGGGGSLSVTDGTTTVDPVTSLAFDGTRFDVTDNGGDEAGVDIATGGIGTTQLADNAVTTVKITDANVTTAKIADSNVTTAKIADSNVTTAKIADSNVTTAKIADDAVTAAKLADTAVTPGSYTNANITVDQQGRLTAASSGSSGVNSRAVLSDRKATTVAGGSASVGWQTRDLNTLEDPDSIVTSLSSNQFVLPSGTYRLIGGAIPGLVVGRFKGALYNVTDTAIQQDDANSDDILTQVGYARANSTTGDGEAVTFPQYEFTIASSKTFEVRMYAQSAFATSGLGLNTDDGTEEIYTYIIIELVS